MRNTDAPIKTGICSFGMSGSVFHAPFLHCMKAFELSAVTERHAKKAKEKYPDIKEYASVESMLEDEDLELIIVNTPNVTHFDYAKKALMAGKNVVVEKPFVATVDQGKELIALAKEKGKLLVVFQNRRWDSDFLTVKKVLDEKRLGKLIEAEIHFDRYRIDPSPKKHKEIPDMGVGLIYDLGPHLIDQAIHLFGKPDAVFARVQKHRPHSKVNDYFNIQLLYPDFTCILKSSLLVREPVPAYQIHGDLGSFIKSRADVQEDNLKKGLIPCTPDWGKEPETERGILHTEENKKVIRKEINTLKGDYSQFFLKLAAAIRQDHTPPIPLSESLLNMEIIEAAIKSQETTSVVKLP